MSAWPCRDLSISYHILQKWSRLRLITQYADLMQLERGAFTNTRLFPPTSIRSHHSFTMRFIMTVRAPSQPVQVCLSASRRQGTPVSASAASPEDRKRADEAYCSVLYQYTKGPENLPYEARYMTPHPILISHRLEDEVRQFHEALAAALNNIVARWYTDKQAAFPTRMPLAQHEEELLQVVQSQQEYDLITTC